MVLLELNLLWWQIFKIFKVLGTPNEQNWPDALKLNDMKGSFPKFRGMPLN